jgi:hypothetical protein
MSDKIEYSVAHRHDMNHIGQNFYPDGKVPFEDREGVACCAYCGSMSPADVVAAIQVGARGSLADMKYGWPHKVYFDQPKWGKFYTVHLQDATPEELEVIEAHLGIKFTFLDEGRGVSWGRFSG